MSSPDVIVIGAGVLGLCAAAELGARGHAVTVLDPGGANASSIAAGMIAPALESLLDDASPDRAALLKRARDLWPAFAGRHGLALSLEGAEWRGPDPDAVADRLRSLGFAADPAQRGVVTPDDWRVDPADALDRLSAAPGVTRETAKAAAIAAGGEGWRVTAADGRAWSAPIVVLATGAAPSLQGLPPAVAGRVGRVRPIRGQLVPIVCTAPARVVRAPGLYAAPSAEGALAGATMEPDSRSLEPDLDVARRQADGALALLGCEGTPAAPRVGVRGATPDGLPMAGPSGAPSLFLALAPRRNGWLLGPLVGRVVADGVEGETPRADAAALDPLRFA